MAVKIRETVETRLGPATFTVRLNDGREFTMRSPKVDDCVDAMHAAREGYLPGELFEKCAVGPAITAGDLAGLTSEEFGELWDLVSSEAAAWADRLLKIHSWEN
jgi:hypothetical protein